LFEMVLYCYIKKYYIFTEKYDLLAIMFL